MPMATNERGETSVESVVLAPVLFTLAFAVVHVASFWMSAHTASVAAARGARAASMASDSRESFELGAGAVEQTVSELGAKLASAPLVEINDKVIRVTVETRIAGVTPFLPHVVRRSVEARRESYVRESDR